MGIDEIFLQDGLFVPFRKVDTFSEGAGLGISIAQHILNLMEGSIKVQSSLGEETLVEMNDRMGERHLKLGTTRILNTQKNGLPENMFPTSRRL